MGEDRSMVQPGSGVEDWNSIVTRVVEATLRREAGFFEQLTRSLAGALDVSSCFITECRDNTGDTVRTLAFWHGQQHLDEFVYSLAGTPCERVFEEGALCFGRGVQALFPDDLDLVNLGAESYAAAPMQDSGGQILGHLALLDGRPFDDRQIDLSMLRLIAQLAAAELSKQRVAEIANERESQLRQIIDLVPHSIFAKDAEGRFWLANEATAEGLGVSVDEIIGRRDEDLVRRELASHFRKDDLHVLKSGRRLDRIEEELVDDLGRRRWISTSKIPFEHAAGKRGVLGVALNVTKQVQAERRLRSLVEATATTLGSAFFSSLVNQLAKSLAVRWVHIGEIETEQVNGLAMCADGDAAEPMTYALAGTPCAEVVTTGAQFEVGQRVLDRYEDLGWLASLGVQSYLGTPLVGADGEVVGVLAVMHDEPKSMDAEDRSLLELFATRAAAELRRQRAERRQRELQAQVLFVQKLESLGVLAGGIAHDFNNLLATILGNVGLALMQTEASEEIRLYLQEIELAAERSAELTRQMLAYSGKERSSEKRLVDLAEIAREMAELLRSSVSKKARLRFDLDQALPAIDADPVQIRQLVLNLITNAAEALQDQAGDVTLRAFAGSPPDGLRESGGERPMGPRCVCLEVCDTGCGMDEETRKRLFDPFYSTKRTGRGLGMATVHGVVRQHRAAIEIDSEPNAGSQIRVWFSSTEAAAESSLREPTKPEKSVEHSGTILVVDDEASVRRTAAKILQHKGYRVVEAADGLEAIDVFKRRRDIDVVLLDLTMPELDGFETLAELRRIQSDVRVILCSGFSKRDASSVEVEGFLAKPYRPSQLVAAIAPLVPEHLRRRS